MNNKRTLVKDADRSEELKDWLRLRLKDIRTQKFDSIPEFAEVSGISSRYVYRIESGESSPTIDILAKWMTACETDFAWFFAPLKRAA